MMFQNIKTVFTWLLFITMLATTHSSYHITPRKPGLSIIQRRHSSLFLRGGAFVNIVAKNTIQDDKTVVVGDDRGISDEEMLNNDDDQSFFKPNTLPIVSSITSIWMKTPPMTQLYLGSSIVLTLSCALFNNNKWPQVLSFSWKSIILELQIWRIFTAFLYFGVLDMFYPLTIQFVWQHMSQLEKLSCNKPEEFLLMLLFGGASLVALYSVLGISMNLLGHNLATYLVYIWSRVFEGTDVNFMDLIVLKSELIPWFFCVQSLILERELPKADLIGIVVGHLYYYLKQKELLMVPKELTNLFSFEYFKEKYAKFRSDFE